MRKPGDMFDRDFEWVQLGLFAGDARAGATLGVVSGRRRQGKTFLLRALCQATGGFYFAAEEAADGESLRRGGAELGRYLGTPPALEFGGGAAGCRCDRRVPVSGQRESVAAFDRPERVRAVAGRTRAQQDPVAAVRLCHVVHGAAAGGERP